MEYTYEDVIINPNDPRVEIGKDYYFALGAQACIDYANRDVKERTLDDIDTSGNYSPFITDGKDYPFIIRKKEPTYEEKQAEWVKTNDIKVGDFVKDKNGRIGIICEIESIEAYIRFNDLLYDVSYLDDLVKIKGHLEPFSLDEEETRSLLGGRYVHYKANGFEPIESPILTFHLCDGAWAIVLPVIGYLNSQNFLDKCKFLNDTPCGIVVEDKE